MAVNVGDVLLTTFSGLWHGQRTINTFYYGINALVGGPTAIAYQTAFDAAIAAVGGLQQKFLACCPTQYQLVERWIQFVAPLRLVKFITGSGSFGTALAASTTANLASVITRKGGTANRHNIGSLHVPYGNNDLGMVNGVIGGVQKTANDALGTQMLTTLTVGAFGNAIPILWSPPLTANAIPLVQTNSQTTVRVMRRRTVGVGK